MRSGSKPHSPTRRPGRIRATRLKDNVFRREGDYWTIVYAGSTTRLRDGIGVRYLAHLLARPNQRCAAQELLAAVQGRAAVDPERTRSAVSKRVRDAITRIERHDQALGYHLSTTIKTGYACAYLPDPGRPVAWTL